jgi:hypothetical protein
MGSKAMPQSMYMDIFIDMALRNKLFEVDFNTISTDSFCNVFTIE